MAITFMRRFRKDAPQMDVPEFPVLPHLITEEHYRYAAEVLQFDPVAFAREFVKSPELTEANMATWNKRGIWVRADISEYTLTHGECTKMSLLEAMPATNYQFFVLGMSERLPVLESITVRDYNDLALDANVLLSRCAGRDSIYPGIFEKEVK